MQYGSQYDCQHGCQVNVHFDVKAMMLKWKNDWKREFVTEIIDINGLLVFIQFILKLSFLECYMITWNTKHWHENVSENDSASYQLGIPENILDNQLENTTTSILSDTGENIQSEGIGACHQFGKTDMKTNSKKTIIYFVNRKHCNNEFTNNKFNFNAEAKLYINKNLTPVNKSIHKLKKYIYCKILNILNRL